MDSRFDLSWSRQHGVGSNEEFGWPTDHLLNADGDDLRWTQYGLAMIFPRECFCPQFPYRGNDMIFWIFLLSLQVTLANLEKNVFVSLLGFAGFTIIETKTEEQNNIYRKPNRKATKLNQNSL